jgi:DnaK suppressor protein
MKTEKNSEYKNKLEKERADLLKELEKDSKPADFGSDIDHYDEEADEAEEFSNQLALGQTIKERVNDIDHALSKIENGGYGICEKCGMEIEEGVLDLSPESRFCKRCKQKSR